MHIALERGLVADLALTEMEKKEIQAKRYHRKTMDAPGYISPNPIAKDYLNLAEPFVKMHPDSYWTSVIYSQIALANMVLHHWQEAADAIDKCSELGLPPDWSKHKTLLMEAREELAKRNWIK